MSKKLLGIFLAAAVLLAVQGALIHPLEHLLRAQSSSAQEATRLAVSIASHVDEQRSEQRTATTNTPTDTPTNAPTTQHTCLLCVALFDVGHLLTSASASAAPVIALGVAPILALHRDVAVATPPIVYDGRAPPRC